MNKLLKKIICIGLAALIMSASVTVPAFADDDEDEGIIITVSKEREEEEKKLSVYSQKKLEEFTADIVKKANKEENLWERFKIIYDFVIDCVEYDYDYYRKSKSDDDLIYIFLGEEAEVGKAWCIINGKAVCSGYSAAIKYLCDKCNITCRRVDDSKHNHSWNQVRIYNNWYNVDACWSDCLFNRYAYFLKTDAQFGKSHWYSATEKRLNPCVTEYDINNPPSPPKNFVEDMSIWNDGILYEYENISDKSSVNLSVGKKVKLSKLVTHDVDDIKVYFSNTKRAKLVKSKSGTLYVKGLKKGPVHLVVVSDGKRTNIKIEIK